jgi:hypothetical protein
MFGADGPNWVEQFQDQNYKIVTEHLWNSGPTIPLKNSMFLTNKNWFWYNEALHYSSLTYDQYIPNKDYKKLALMPMWHHRDYRDQLIIKLSDLLDNLIYSYAKNGIFLPNDDEINSTRYNYFRPEWYDTTYFSIVAETRIDTEYFFISEKTYKPIAFYHPFIIVGQPKILDYLHQQGFETYENLFDESYDLEYNFNNRFKKIIQNIRNYKPMPYDVTTQNKLEHNHNLFFNINLVKQRFVDEIVNPIIDYFETKQ